VTVRSLLYAIRVFTFTMQHAASAQSHLNYTFEVVTFFRIAQYTKITMAKIPDIQVPFDTPAPYRIQVQGRVASSWSDRLQGMDISQATSDAGIFVSTLTGELPDQTALAGVLNALYEMHLSVLSVECLKKV
jgi:hypothetical protein